MKLTVAVIVAAVLGAIALEGCVSQQSTATAQPDFHVVSALWLLCPAQAADLKTCCPQPADPRRCVMPSGSAPTDLIAFGRFVNAGVSGRAMATFIAESSIAAWCRAPIPYTESGAAAVSWCSLGPTTEPQTSPQVTVSEGGG